jgi:hypothetical protein
MKKSGKETHGSTGDIEPTDPIAEPFFKVCSMELKYGYGQWCLLDVLDKRGTTAKCLFEQFWEQTVRQAELVTPAKIPVLIMRRTNRRIVLATTRSLFSQLILEFGVPNTDVIYIRLENPNLSEILRNLVVIKLVDFYDWVDPLYFNELAKGA